MEAQCRTIYTTSDCIANRRSRSFTILAVLHHARVFILSIRTASVQNAPCDGAMR